MANRNGGSSYRYGLNGMEQDDEVSGKGNSYTAQFWQYDSRLAKRWNRDPITYPFHSPYVVFNNAPILYADPLGLYGKNKAKRKHKRAVKRYGEDRVGDVHYNDVTDDYGFGVVNDYNKTKYTSSSPNAEGGVDITTASRTFINDNKKFRQFDSREPYSFGQLATLTFDDDGSVLDPRRVLNILDKHYNGSLGISTSAVDKFNKISNSSLRHWSHKLSRKNIKLSPFKSGDLFNAAKSFGKRTGKLTSKLGPLGTGLTIIVVTDEILNDTWDAHTAINTGLMIGTVVATTAGAPLIITAIFIYGVTDYVFDIGTVIDNNVGRHSKLMNRGGHPMLITP